MGSIIKVNFNRSSDSIIYSADVYSHDMKKYQFQASTESIAEAYQVFINEAASCDVRVVKCIAIYKGAINARQFSQPPIKAWHQQNGKLG